jgi:hypothetical protein
MRYIMIALTLALLVSRVAISEKHRKDSLTKQQTDTVSH